MDEAVVRAHPEPWNVNWRRTSTPIYTLRALAPFWKATGLQAWPTLFVSENLLTIGVSQIS